LISLEAKQLEVTVLGLRRIITELAVGRRIVAYNKGGGAFRMCEQKHKSFELNKAQMVKKLLTFMEPRISLPRLQKPVTGPYPMPDESSLHIRNLFHHDFF
jgi:hypothetical protein